jgi:hypothetical protein
METEPRLGFITRPRVLGALALSVAAIGFFQAGRDVEHPNDTQIRIGDPLSWIAAPIADFAESVGLVDTPSETPPKH